MRPVLNVNLRHSARKQVSLPLDVIQFQSQKPLANGTNKAGRLLQLNATLIKVKALMPEQALKQGLSKARNVMRKALPDKHSLREKCNQNKGIASPKAMRLLIIAHHLHSVTKPRLAILNVMFQHKAHPEEQARHNNHKHAQVIADNQLLRLREHKAGLIHHHQTRIVKAILHLAGVILHLRVALHLHAHPAVIHPQAVVQDPVVVEVEAVVAEAEVVVAEVAVAEDNILMK